MDLPGIQNRLAALGVTLRFETDLPANVVPATLLLQRQYRASLYIDQLTATRTFLTQALNTPAGPGLQGLGAGYPFVAQALNSADLLNQLAASLDEWVCPAVDRAITLAAPVTYQNWFNNSIFNVGDLAYAANVTAFFADYPITQHALAQITADFQNNIARAMQRVIADRAAIVALFADRYNWLTLSALSKITSTGSDFHKGGQQVLILTFATRSFGGWSPLTGTLKLVYKPADIEIDCLVAGNSAAVNRATGNPAFLAASLVEIFNAYAQAHPAPGLEQLPTYRILPRNPVSLAVGGPPWPVRDAYGYIEFLNYDFSGQTWKAFNYYPLGSSDYVIFRSQQAGPLVQRYYRQAGQLLALASTFSLTDLHVENVRVTAYVPRLIDLEASLTQAIDNVRDTLLIDANADIGGFTGSVRGNEDFIWYFNPALSQEFVQKTYENRLWTMRPDRRLILVNAFWLLQGLASGMNVLRAIQQGNGFNAWLGRAANVLVRVIPLATSSWAAARMNIYSDQVMISNPPGAPALLPAAVAEAHLAQVTGSYNSYMAQAPPPPQPKYAAVNVAQAAADLTNFDIPAFYHRIGSTELLDSTGADVVVPANVTVLDNHGIQVQVPTGWGAAYFGGAPPTPATVGAQLAALTGVGFPLANYQAQSLVTLGLHILPDAPGALF